MKFLEIQYNVEECFFLLGTQKVYLSLIDILIIIGLSVDGKVVTDSQIHDSITCLKYLEKKWMLWVKQ